MFEYFTKLETSVTEQLEHFSKNPPKESVLLEALKPFTAPHQHEKIDKMISNFNRLETIKAFRRENTVIAAATPTETINKIIDDSVHEDGVYDVDGACSPGISPQNTISAAPPLSLMLLLFLLKR